REVLRRPAGDPVVSVTGRAGRGVPDRLQGDHVAAPAGGSGRGYSKPHHEAGRPGKVNMPKRALVLIDIQNDYFPGGKWTLSGIESAADNAARVLAAARAAGDLVVHVRHEFPTADAPFFAPRSSGAQIHPKVQDREGEPVVLKHHVNSFRETDLKALLDSQGVEVVVICGAMSHMCVDAGARAASDLGYRCVVVHDACATRDQEFEGAVVPAAQVHAAFMAALRFGYARLVTTAEYLAGKAK